MTETQPFRAFDTIPQVDAGAAMHGLWRRDSPTISGLRSIWFYEKTQPFCGYPHTPLPWKKNEGGTNAKWGGEAACPGVHDM